MASINRNMLYSSSCNAEIRSTLFQTSTELCPKIVFQWMKKVIMVKNPANKQIYQLQSVLKYRNNNDNCSKLEKSYCKMF